MKHKYTIFSLVSLLFLILSAHFAWAGSATLQWNTNSETDLAGYRIYYGTSARTGTDPKTCTLCGYTTKVDVGKVTTYTISNLTNNTTYYFSVSAYDTSNNESAFSSQVSKLISKSADLNSDGYVNMQDASILMTNWGSSAKPKADINQDGIVNMQDASIMMSQWGS